MDAIPSLLTPLFSSFGIRPTYFLSPEVISNRVCCDLLRNLPDCELATHLHAEYVVPGVETWDFCGPEFRVVQMQWECGRVLEQQKLEVLTELFYQQFDRMPKSFRAGRFGISKDTGQILIDLGYVVDSSVTPHIRWQSRGQKTTGLPSLPRNTV